MHVLHVITTLNKGGAETHLVELCRCLSARGVELTVAFLKGDAYWVPELRRLGVRTIDLAARRYADPAAVRRLARAIDHHRPDLIHAHMPPAEVYANFALRLGRKVPLVISKHVDRHPFYGGPASSWLERFCAEPAQAVICISQAVNDYFAQLWPEELRRKLVTVRYGLDPVDAGDPVEAAGELRREWGVGEGDVLIGAVARLVEQKSIDTLLHAFALLRRETDGAVKLALVGQGPLEADLRALADRLGIADAVIWAGFRTDIPAVMRALDVFVLSSIYEGFGLVLLEAMEAATPIVASRISAIPEIVVEGDTGFLVPARDPPQLAAAMAKMLDAPSRGAMGANGRRRLIEAFGAERMTDETVALYEGVLGRGVAADPAVRRVA